MPAMRTPRDPGHHEAGEAALADWRRQEAEPPPDSVLHGRYWEDGVAAPDDRPRPRAWILPALFIVGVLAVGLVLVLG
ncbi:MAG: hypothetical protein ACKVPY_15270 [Paracoccaceae bacterium]